MRKQRRSSGQFKAKIALKALCGSRVIQEIVGKQKDASIIPQCLLENTEAFLVA